MSEVQTMIRKAQGYAGMLNTTEVARRASLQARTVRSAGEQTTVETLRKIATGLGGRLVIRIDFDEREG